MIKTKYFLIPMTTDIEDSVKVHFGEETTIEVTKNIFFRAFGIYLVIPIGFVSNGNSFPFFLRAFISPYNPKWLFAGLFHDYLYATQFLPRIIADLIYYYVLVFTAGGIPAYVFYKGVRLGGWKAWRDAQEK
jgi:hypothetical protein